MLEAAQVWELNDPIHTFARVGNVSTAVLAANPARRVLILVNDDEQDTIWVSFGRAAAVHEGIRLNAGGGALTLSAQMGSVYQGAIYAIHAGAGNARLLVTEGV